MLRTREFTDIFSSRSIKMICLVHWDCQTRTSWDCSIWSVVRSPSSSVGNALVYWASGSIPIGGGDILKGISGATADSNTLSPIVFTWLSTVEKDINRVMMPSSRCVDRSLLCVCVCVCVCMCVCCVCVCHSVLTKTMFCVDRKYT